MQGDKTSRSCFFLQLTKSAEICIKTRWISSTSVAQTNQYLSSVSLCYLGPSSSMVRASLGLRLWLTFGAQKFELKLTNKQPTNQKIHKLTTNRPKNPTTNNQPKNQTTKKSYNQLKNQPTNNQLTRKSNNQATKRYSNLYMKLRKYRPCE